MKLKSFVLPSCLLLAAVGILFLFYACDKTKNVQNSDSTISFSSTILEANDTLENDLILPVGTQITTHPDKPKTMHILFPANYRFIGITTALQSVNLQSFDITCSCTAGSAGCSPYSNPKASGCVTTGNCTTCTQKNSYSFQDEDVALGEGAIIDISTGIHFITSQAEVSAIRPAYASLLQDSSVLGSLRQFAAANNISDAFATADSSTSGVLPRGYVYLPISLYGRSLLIPVHQNVLSSIASTDFNPSAKIADLEQMEVEQPFSAYSCSCSSGPGCEKYAYYIPFLGMNYFCKAGSCMSCTLHTPN